MDFSPIVNQLVYALVWIVPAMLVILFFKSAYFKGYLGEQMVRFGMWLRLDKRVYHRLHDIILETPDGTTQIDHVIVSRFGVFVIETKNMKGWIFGSETQPQWTQKLFKKSFKFQNPLRQNYKHVKALEATLQIPVETIHSVVTFVGDCALKTPMPPNVTMGGRFISYIKSFKTPIFTEEHVNTLVQRLNHTRIASSLETRRAHVESLNERHAGSEPRACPKCASPLVLRTAKKGPSAGKQFWGCSAYPSCRMVVNA